MTPWIPVFHDNQQFYVRYVGDEIDVWFWDAPEPFTWLNCDPYAPTDEFSELEVSQACALLEHLADHADAVARWLKDAA